MVDVSATQWHEGVHRSALSPLPPLQAYMFHSRYLQKGHKVYARSIRQSLHQGGKQQVDRPELRELLYTQWGMGNIEHPPTNPPAHPHAQHLGEVHKTGSEGCS